MITYHVEPELTAALRKHGNLAQSVEQVLKCLPQGAIQRLQDPPAHPKVGTPNTYQVANSGQVGSNCQDEKVPQGALAIGDPIEYLESYRTWMELHGHVQGLPTYTLGAVAVASNHVLSLLLQSRLDPILELRNGCSDNLMLSAIMAGLKPSKLLWLLGKNDPKDFQELICRDQKYANAETLMTSRRDEMTKYGEKRKRSPDRRPTEHKKGKDESSNSAKPPRAPKGRFQYYTSLTTSADQVFIQIWDDNLLKWPAKIKTPPEKKDKTKYCRFHKDHGHNTEDYVALKDEIEAPSGGTGTGDTPAGGIDGSEDPAT
ncbi:hypothetical protein FNV43_RR22624 [Rhamnella rubrinervis]|uniref:Uncharacterized protein n=1 Tax=Rhamnella rubrinervis TaxID=2594499 RepID=A0A8K0GVC9_9ROSA|nr:hypothetical protein FNV43_RR22624 [Rhamnella rubrinervis]